MKKFWNQNNEAKALLVSTFLTILGVCGTAFLFWFHHYDIPLAVLLGGSIVSLTWLGLCLTKKSAKPHIKTDITFIYIRLTLIVGFAILFGVLAYKCSLVVVSPVYLIVSYLAVSLVATAFYIKKGE